MERTLARTLIALYISVPLMSCGTIASAGPDQPALIRSPTSQGLAQLRAALVEASYGAPVTVAGDVFSTSSRLALEQGAGASPHLTGRDLGAPRIFRLVKNDRGCWLVRNEDGERWPLKNLGCVPE